MKKLVVVLLTLAASGSLSALPISNPTEASLFLRGAWWDIGCCDPCDPCFSWCEAWNFRAGYYGDFVFNRYLEVSTHSNHAGHHIRKMQIFTNAAYMAFNICDRLDIFGTLGTSQMHIKTNARSWNFPTSLESELFFKTDLSWSVGARATVWRCDCFAVGLEGQYFQSVPHLDSFLEYNNGTITYFRDIDGSNYSEWQIGLGLSYRFATRCPTIAMVPYAGVKWAGARFNLGNFSFTAPISGVTRTFTLPTLKSGKLWGYAVGMSLTLCDMVGVTVEGRFGDEQALYVNGEFRF